MKKIVVRVITYNQEDVIKRALDSVLCQKDWGLYRLIVSDDCSKDHTWEILQDYKHNYPDIMDVHRNEQNLGIYGNIEQSNTYLPDDYDLLGVLSGDDEYCDGYFKGIQNLIEAEQIDVNDEVAFFSDWKTVRNNGEETIHKQNSVLSGFRPWSLKARGLLSNRSMLASRKLFCSYEPSLRGYGLNLIESHFDAQPMLYAKKVYYLPQVTSIYYSGVGVSTTLKDYKSDYRTNQNIEKWNYALEHYIVDKRDFHLAKYQIERSKFFIRPRLVKIMIIMYHKILSQLPGYFEPRSNFAQEVGFLTRFCFLND